MCYYVEHVGNYPTGGVHMSVTLEIAKIRAWLREDETRLRSPSVESPGEVAEEQQRSLGPVTAFYDWSDVGTPGGPWPKFNQWGNGG
jgi:hypothetical protein